MGLSTGRIPLLLYIGMAGGRILSSENTAGIPRDLVDRKSILAYIYIFVGSLISYISRKQKLVTTLTTKAEYIVLSIYVKKSL